MRRDIRANEQRILYAARGRWVSIWTSGVAGVEVTSNSARIAGRPSIVSLFAMKSIAASVILIIICGGGGGVAAWGLVSWLALTGPVGALVAAAAGMVIAVAAFAGTTTLLRGAGWMK